MQPALSDLPAIISNIALDTQSRNAAGHFCRSLEGGRKNLPPIKLSTRSPNKAICVGKRMHYSSFRRDSDGGTSPSEKRDSCPGLGGGDKREAGFHNLFCLVNNVLRTNRFAASSFICRPVNGTIIQLQKHRGSKKKKRSRKRADFCPFISCECFYANA